MSKVSGTQQAIGTDTLIETLLQDLPLKEFALVFLSSPTVVPTNRLLLQKYWFLLVTGVKIHTVLCKQLCMY